MKTLLLGIFTLAFIPSLIAQDTLEEEVFPLMYNSPPSYVCCDICNEASNDTLSYVLIHFLKDTIMPTNYMLRDKKIHRQPRYLVVTFEKSHSNARYKQFEMLIVHPFRKFKIYRDTFYLRKENGRIDIAPQFFWVVRPEDTLVFKNSKINKDSIGVNYKVYPMENFFHISYAPVYRREWEFYLYHNSYLGKNTNTTYNEYIQDSVYEMSLRDAYDASSEIRKMYISYKYGIVGITTRYIEYNNFYECETWFPPFHSPTFRKEENPPMKEE